MTENQLATTTPTEVTPNIDTAGGYMALIEKLSNNPTLQNVEIIERMMNMQERWEERNSRKLFDDAKARASTKMKHIKIVKKREVAYDIDKNNKNAGQKTAFRYAALEDIDKIIAPILQEEKIDLSYKIEPCSTPGWHTIVCWLSHAGHREPYPMPMPLDTTGGKGNAQAMGSTQMYGMRRALCGAFNLIPLNEDNDGAGEAISTEQAAEIDLLIVESKVNREKFLKNMGVADVRDIIIKDFARAINSLKAVLFDKQKKEAKKAGNDGKA